MAVMALGLPYLAFCPIIPSFNKSGPMADILQFPKYPPLSPLPDATFFESSGVVIDEPTDGGVVSVTPRLIRPEELYPDAPEERNFAGFCAEVEEFVKTASLLLSDSEELGAFLEDTVRVAESNLGIELSEEERFWLTKLILNFREFLDKQNTLTEMLNRASSKHGVFQHGHECLRVGNIGLMAASGFAPLKRTQTGGSRMRFYTHQADAAYYRAGRLLNNRFYLSITHIGENRIPDFVDIVGFLRFLCVQKDLVRLYKFVAERSRLRVKFAPLMDEVIPLSP